MYATSPGDCQGPFNNRLSVSVNETLALRNMHYENAFYQGRAGNTVYTALSSRAESQFPQEIKVSIVEVSRETGYYRDGGARINIETPTSTYAEKCGGEDLAPSPHRHIPGKNIRQAPNPEFPLRHRDVRQKNDARAIGAI